MSARRRLTTMLSLIALALVASARPPLFAQDTPRYTALTGVTVIDGTGAPPRSGMTVLIRDDLIHSVHPGGELALGDTVDIRALDGLWVIPGLIDAHVHVGVDPTREGSRTVVEPALARMLSGGVTAVRDMAGDATVLSLLALRARIGDLPAPDVFYSALIAGPEFVANDFRPQAILQNALPPHAYLQRYSPASDPVLVTAMARGTGAIGLKAYSDLDAHVLPDLFREAKARGMLVWAHGAIMPARPSDVVRAGADVISHPSEFGCEVVGCRTRQDPWVAPRQVSADHPALQQLLRDMAAAGTILDSTLDIFQPGGPFASDRTALEFGASLIGEGHALGVAIAAGTDAFSPLVGGTCENPTPPLHHEMETLVVEAGLTPLEALKAATATAARTIGEGATRGQVLRGYRADLVVLEADPSVDIRNTTRIQSVYKGGVLQPDRSDAGCP